MACTIFQTCYLQATKGYIAASSNWTPRFGKSKRSMAAERCEFISISSENGQIQLECWSLQRWWHFGCMGIPVNRRTITIIDVLLFKWNFALFAAFQLEWLRHSKPMKSIMVRAMERWFFDISQRKSLKWDTICMPQYSKQIPRRVRCSVSWDSSQLRRTIGLWAKLNGRPQMSETNLYLSAFVTLASKVKKNTG